MDPPLGAGVSYDIIDLNIKMMSVVRWMVVSKLKSLEDSTRDRPTKWPLKSLNLFLTVFDVPIILNHTKYNSSV